MTGNPTDPDGTRLPVKLDATSNGEFEPIPLSTTNRTANQLAHENASRNARRVGTYGPRTRREFLNLLGWNGGSRA